MYRGYEIGSLTFKKDYENFLPSDCNEAVKEVLEKYLSPEGFLFAQDIMDDWFPEIKADIFISHSHHDEKLAKKLAGWLYENFGLVSFIDSYFWGYCNDLQKKIDNKYCMNDGQKTYSYEKRNGSTSHVHMMLSMALMKMIDKCECVFFINTPSSINSETSIEEISKIGKAIEKTTSSPWIYSEILMTKLINKNIPERYFKIGVGVESHKVHEAYTKDESLKIKYDVNLDHFINLSSNDLNKWRNKVAGMSSVTKEKALDTLYELTPLKRKY